jgi:hypothetical protein
MKKPIIVIALVVLAASLLFARWSRREASVWNSLKSQATVERLKRFMAQKEAQEKMLADAEDKENAALVMKESFEVKSPDCRPFFAAASKGNWRTISNLWSGLEEGAYNAIGPHTGKKGGWLSKAFGVIKAAFHLGNTKIYFHGKWQQPVSEAFGAIEAFAIGNEKYSSAFGRDIIDSMPMGSIYFGGTDPGRFIVTVMCSSQPDGEPVFTLTQNSLADGSYLDYLRSMYGGKIYIPTQSDVQTVFQDYQTAFMAHQVSRSIEPGETNANTKVGKQPVGQFTVLELNGHLAKVIFDKNPDREFFIVEGTPLEWMNPYLEPHGLIMRINRLPLGELSEETLKKDHDYWAKYITPMIGDWLHDETPISEIEAFAKRTYGDDNLEGFKGDPEFVRNPYSQKMFSKLRSSIAGIYFWRMKQTNDASEKQRMATVADLAFRQAIALSPDSLEVVFRYLDFLTGQKRWADSLMVARIAASMPRLKEDERHALNDVVKRLEEAVKQN